MERSTSHSRLTMSKSPPPRASTTGVPWPHPWARTGRAQESRGIGRKNRLVRPGCFRQTLRVMRGLPLARPRLLPIAAGHSLADRRLAIDQGCDVLPVKRLGSERVEDELHVLPVLFVLNGEAYIVPIKLPRHGKEANREDLRMRVQKAGRI